MCRFCALSQLRALCVMRARFATLLDTGPVETHFPLAELFCAVHMSTEPPPLSSGYYDERGYSSRFNAKIGRVRSFGRSRACGAAAGSCQSCGSGRVSCCCGGRSSGRGPSECVGVGACCPRWLCSSSCSCSRSVFFRSGAICSIGDGLRGGSAGGCCCCAVPRSCRAAFRACGAACRSGDRRRGTTICRHSQRCCGCGGIA